MTDNHQVTTDKTSTQEVNVDVDVDIAQAVAVVAMARYKELARIKVLNGNAAVTVEMLVRGYCGMGRYRNDPDGTKIATLEQKCTRADIQTARERFVAITTYRLPNSRLLPGRRAAWYATTSQRRRPGA